jgi:hypothetical protein
MARRLALLLVAALALLLAAASISCVETETADEESLPSGAFKVVETASLPRLVYLADGKLTLVDIGKKPRILSERGVPELPVSGFDLCSASGEVALAHGGSVGVVPLEPKPASAKPSQRKEPPAEEWYDLRESAGSDFFVSLVRIAPDGSRVLAGGYGASSVDEGFRLFMVGRAGGSVSAVTLTGAERTMMLRDAAFDSTGAAFLWLSDENIPDSILYTVQADGLKRICGVEDLLGEGTGEDYDPGREGLGAVISAELLAFVPRGGELLLVVYPLEQDASGEPVGHTEFWRYGIADGKIAQRTNPARDGEDLGFIFSTTSTPDRLYFARLLESASGDDGGNAAAQEVRIGALDYASGEVKQVCALSLDAQQPLHSAAIFPAAEAVAVVLEADAGYLISVYGFDGKQLIGGIQSASPAIALLPPREKG